MCRGQLVMRFHCYYFMFQLATYLTHWCSPLSPDASMHAHYEVFHKASITDHIPLEHEYLIPSLPTANMDNMLHRHNNANHPITPRDPDPHLHHPND